MRISIVVSISIAIFLAATECNGFEKRHSAEYSEIRNSFIPPETILKILEPDRIVMFDSISFSILAEWINGSVIEGACFQARLVGPAIVDVDVEETLPGLYKFNFTLGDMAPSYLLQIRLTWFTGKCLIEGIPLNHYACRCCGVYRYWDQRRSVPIYSSAIRFS